MSELNQKTIIVVGGGTGGHSYPAWRIACALRQMGHSIYLISDIDNPLQAQCSLHKIKFIGIDTGKLIRSISPKFWLKNFTNSAKTAYAFLAIRNKIKKIKPDVIFSKGGFVSFPICLSAKTLLIPLIMHESDSVIGLSNEYFLDYAKKLCVGFPTINYPVNIRKKLVYTSIPIDDHFIKTELPENSKKILVIGGSQGAEPVNRLMLKAVQDMDPSYIITWITGKANYEPTKERLASISKKIPKIKLLNYSDKVYSLLQENSIIISRSGFTTIVEAAAVSRPMILIPFADSSRNHQYKNAEILSKQNAALMMNQDDDPSVLIEAIKFLQVKKNARTLAKNLNKFYNRESVDLILKEILSE